MKTYHELSSFIHNLLDDEILLINKLLPKNANDTAINNVIFSKRGRICPHCKSVNVVKNGLKNNRQKFYCKDCKKNFSVNTSSISYKTHFKYDSWIKFIHCELLQCTLFEEAKECGISQTTAFYWRQKLHKAISNIARNVKLSGIVQIDSKFYDINLKGTKPENMPRYSKKRGTKSSYFGISREKICVICAVDEMDNLVIEVSGIGRENTIMMTEFEKHLDNCTLLVCDGQHAVVTMAKRNKIDVEIVKSSSYTNENYYNLAEVNQIHSDLEVDLKPRRGVSLRHLQGYLDMYWFKRLLKFTTEYEDKDRKFFHNTIPQNINFYIKEICKKALPINLNDIYGVFK